MSNSPLVSYTKLSPNHSGQRTHAVDRITPHCVVEMCIRDRPIRRKMLIWFKEVMIQNGDVFWFQTETCLECIYR